jgi:hypothetical protein
MNTITQKLLGYVLLALVLFAVLFDPTEMALGGDYITLSAGMLSFAEIVGNFVWLFGVLYAIIIFGVVTLFVDDDNFEKALEQNRDAGLLKGYAKKWYELPHFVLNMTIALIAIGSGFWFTGTALALALIAIRALRVKVQGHETV